MHQINKSKGADPEGKIVGLWGDRSPGFKRHSLGPNIRAPANDLEREDLPDRSSCQDARTLPAIWHSPVIRPTVELPQGSRLQMAIAWVPQAAAIVIDYNESPRRTDTM